MLAWANTVSLCRGRSRARAQTREILRAPPALRRPVVTSEEVAPPGHAWRRRSFRGELGLVPVAGTDSLWNSTRRQTTQTYGGPRTLHFRQRTEGRHQPQSCRPIRMFRLHTSFPKPANRAHIPIRQTLILLSTASWMARSVSLTSGEVGQQAGTHDRAATWPGDPG